jgi:hypothetical protein
MEAASSEAVVLVAGGCGFHHAGGSVHIEPRHRQFSQLTRSLVIQGKFFSNHEVLDSLALSA